MDDIQPISKSTIKPSITRYIPLGETPKMFDFSTRGREWQYTAIIGWSDQNFSHGYIEGFYQAAEILVTQGVPLYDYLVYPIIFNYRHYVELALKNLNLLFRLHFCEEIRFMKIHNIEGLLNELTFILDSYQIGHLLPEEIRLAIMEISEIDKKNDRFRYTHDISGHLSHEYTHNFIDLKRFDLGMKQIHEYLEFMATWFDEEQYGGLTNFHFVNYINTFSNLTKKGHLIDSKELANKFYLFGSSQTTPQHPSNLLDQSITDTRRFFVDRETISEDSQNNTIECIIKFSVDNKEVSFAKVIFNLKGDKILNLRVSETA